MTAEGRLRVALTFDAENIGRTLAHIETLPTILDVLRTNEVRATFFVQAGWAQRFPDFARKIADAGHLVGSHGLQHIPWGPILSDEPERMADFTTDLATARQIIHQTTFADPYPWFRAPFGSGTFEMQPTLDDLGWQNVLWNLDSDDSKGANVAETVKVKAAGHIWNAVVALFHTWSPETARDLAQVIASLRGEKGHYGLEFVTVAQLVPDEPR